MAAGDVVKIEVITTGPNLTQMVNVLHFGQAGDVGIDFDAVGLNAFVAAVATMLVARYIAIMSTFVTWDRVIGTVLGGGAAGLQAFSTLGQGTAGSTLGGDGPIERCLIYSLRTPFAGRAHRGRMYSIAPCVDSFNDEGTYQGGNPDAAAQVQLRNHLLDIFPGPATPCMQLCIATALGSDVHYVNRILLSQVAGTQRRRKEA